MALTNKERCDKYRFSKPWCISLKGAKQRCTNPNNPEFYCYGGRGIKFSLTMNEGKELWFRDKAYLMKCPTIDRIDNDGNYCIDNCRFIEKSENTIKANKISILQYDLKGNFIREWNSLLEASKSVNRHIASICDVLKGRSKTCAKYIFKYK